MIEVLVYLFVNASFLAMFAGLWAIARGPNRRAMPG